MTGDFPTLRLDPFRRGASRAARASLRRGAFERPETLRRAAACLLFLAALLCAGLALAYDFPPLSGRVVDAANVLPAATKAALAQKLQALEDKSGIQLEVATVPSLGGDEIEPYANALFREWKLGEKDKNNGVLLLVAPNEHRVRIEVGYGLEGTLTDALSSVIISNAIAPRFKAGDFGGGITRGVDDIITVLTTDAADWQKRPDLRLDRHESQTDALTPWLVFGLFLFIIFMLTRAPRARQGVSAGGDPRWNDARGGALDPRQRAPGESSYFWSNLLSFILGVLSNSGGRGGGWGDGGGGGFSGGGGSSGGGGASGSW